GPQVSQYIKEPLDFFKLYFIDILVDHSWVDVDLPYYGLTTESLEKAELPVSSRIPLTLVKKLLDNIGMEMYTVNSYILCKKMKETNNETLLTHLNFVKHLIDQLVGNFSNGTSSELKKTVQYITKNEESKCSSDRKIPGKRRETHYDTCIRKPGFHIGDCFVKYHTLENYKN
ncbi:hypothetical protein WN51_08690, partial [Melipona quadrifasciata]